MNRLGQQTGGDENSRNREAHDLLEIIINGGGDREKMSDWESNFVDDMVRRLDENLAFIPTGKQIFKLRDIRDKLL